MKQQLVHGVVLAAIMAGAIGAAGAARAADATYTTTEVVTVSVQPADDGAGTTGSKMSAGLQRVADFGHRMMADGRARAASDYAQARASLHDGVQKLERVFHRDTTS
jgi:hypothetical protein